jgi:hypothetical protein
VEKERKKQDKKERARKAKSELRAKMSVIASTDIYNQNDDVLFDRRTLERLQKVDIEDLDYEEDEFEDADGGAVVEGLEQAVPGRILEERSKKAAKASKGGSDSESVDEEHQRFEEMAAGIDEYYKRQKDYNMEVDRQLQKKEKKRKALIEQQRLKKEDVSEEEELNNDDIRIANEVLTAKKKPAKKGVQFESDVEMSESDDDGLFVNPLLLKDNPKKAAKAAKQAADKVDDQGFSSADEEDEIMLKKNDKRRDAVD